MPTYYHKRTSDEELDRVGLEAGIMIVGLLFAGVVQLVQNWRKNDMYGKEADFDYLSAGVTIGECDQVSYVLERPDQVTDQMTLDSGENHQ